MKLCRSKVDSSNTIDLKTFGKFEPGNKVYYDELEAYFNKLEEFTSQGKEFKRDIVPKFKVLGSLT